MMRISCHRAVQGHDRRRGYDAEMLISRTGTPDHAVTFALPFSGVFRDIPDDGSQGYYLEIAPADKKYQYMAAGCSRWITDGTRSQYTAWLIPEVPEDERADMAMRLLRRENFIISGKDMERYYEDQTTLRMLEVAAPDYEAQPDWSVTATDLQRVNLGQFLAMYWLGMASRKQIALILREGNGRVMSIERAVEFFHREIVSRLPGEARRMLSVVFGVNGDLARESFGNSICVVLPGEADSLWDEDVVIDLMNSPTELRQQYAESNRSLSEAIALLGRCLMAGEANYPAMYKALRAGLRGGIPLNGAAKLMTMCLQLEKARTSTRGIDEKTDLFEKCLRGIRGEAVRGGADDADLGRVLKPLAGEIGGLWGQVSRADLAMYNEKRKWLENRGFSDAREMAELLDPLACAIAARLGSSDCRLVATEKVRAAAEVINGQKAFAQSQAVRPLEDLLEEHLQELLDLVGQGAASGGIMLDAGTIGRVLEKWSPREDADDPIDLLPKLDRLFMRYSEQELTTQARNAALMPVRRLWISRRVSMLLASSETPTPEMLREIGGLVRDVGTFDESQKCARTGLDYLKQHYLAWILEEPVFIKGDTRFLTLAGEWLGEVFPGVAEDLDLKTLEMIETNLRATFRAYGKSDGDQNIALRPVFAAKGMAELTRIEGEPMEDNTLRALQIARLHYRLRFEVRVLSPGDDADRRFTGAMTRWFVDWSRSEAPFASDEEGRYRDDWFVSVVREWLKTPGLDEVPGVEELEKLVRPVLIRYGRNQADQSSILMPLGCATAEKRMREVLHGEAYQDPTERALALAEIHADLKRNWAGLLESGKGKELEEELARELADLFLDWMKAEPPFASGRNRRYEDGWFTCVLKLWVDTCLMNIGGAEQLREMSEKLKKMPAYYSIAPELIEAIRKQYALLFVREISGRGDDGEGCLRAAELLFGDEETAGEAELRETLADYLARELGVWAGQAFAIERGAGRNRADLFVEILTRWQENYMTMQETELLVQVRAALRSGGFFRFGVRQEDRAQLMLPLEYEIRGKQLDRLSRYGAEIQPEDLSLVAGIRLWMADNGEQLKDRGFVDLSEEAESFLRQHVDLWVTCDPPLSVEGMRGVADFAIPLAVSWIVDVFDYEFDRMEAEQRSRLTKILEEVLNNYRRDTKEIDSFCKAKEILVRLKQRSFIEEMHAAIDRSRETGEEIAQDDLIRLADVYAQTRSNSVYEENQDAARKELLRVFLQWGLMGHFELLPRSDHKKVDLDQLVRDWVGTLRYDRIVVANALEMSDRLKDVQSKYHLARDVMDELTGVIYTYCADVLCEGNGGEAGPSESQLAEAMKLYAQQVGFDGKTKLRDMLTAHLDLVLDAPEAPRGNALADLLKEWKQNHLPARGFGAPAEILTLRDELDRKMTGASVPDADRREILAGLERRWMQEAIAGYGKSEEARVTVAEIAAVESRLRKLDHPLEDEDKDKLERFLIDHFLEWEQDSFRSPDGREEYACVLLPDLADEWLKGVGLGQMTDPGEIGSLEKQLSSALESYRKVNSNAILQPIRDRRNELILGKARSEAERNGYDDRLVEIVSNIYREKPGRFDGKVFDFMMGAVHARASMDKVEDFISLLSNAWKDSSDDMERVGIARFLNSAHRALIIAGKGCPSLTRTMKNILEQVNFDLTAFPADSRDKWTQERDEEMDTRINAFVKNASAVKELAGEWQRTLAGLLSTDWVAVVQTQAFAEALDKKVQDEWRGCRTDEARVTYLEEMTRMAFAPATDRTFSGLLTDWIRELLDKHFDSLYQDMALEKRLDRVLEDLEHGGVDVTALRNSEAFCTAGFCEQYNDLAKRWDTGAAETLLEKRPPLVANAAKRLEGRPLGMTDEQRLLLAVLYGAADKDGAAKAGSGCWYWKDLLAARGADLAVLNGVKKAGDVATTSLVKVLYDCYIALARISAAWALDELKACLKNGSPNLWQKLHPISHFVLGIGGIWKQIEGEKAVPETAACCKDFREWLLK